MARIFREFAASPPAVSAEAVKAIQGMGYGITSQDQGRITFKTGSSGRSWGGQHMTATVVPSGGGRTRVEMTGQRNVWQAYDWGEAESIGRRVLLAMEVGGPASNAQVDQNLTNPMRWLWNILFAFVMAGLLLLVLAFFEFVW